MSSHGPSALLVYRRRESDSIAVFLAVEGFGEALWRWRHGGGVMHEGDSEQVDPVAGTRIWLGTHRALRSYRAFLKRSPSPVTVSPRLIVPYQHHKRRCAATCNSLTFGSHWILV